MNQRSKKSSGDTISPIELKALSRQFRTFPMPKLLDFADALNRMIEIELRNNGQTRIQAIALHFLVYNGGSMLSTELSRMMFRPNHNMTKLLDDLEKRGFVTREYIKGDRRVLMVKLSRAGFNLAKRNLERGKIQAKELLFDVDALEQEILEDLVMKMRTNIVRFIDKNAGGTSVPNR
jgi:DNA-binding MarR family transcriptional regulator